MREIISLPVILIYHCIDEQAVMNDLIYGIEEMAMTPGGITIKTAQLLNEEHTINIFKHQIDRNVPENELDHTMPRMHPYLLKLEIDTDKELKGTTLPWLENGLYEWLKEYTWASFGCFLYTHDSEKTFSLFEVFKIIKEENQYLYEDDHEDDHSIIDYYAGLLYSLYYETEESIKRKYPVEYAKYLLQYSGQHSENVAI